MGQEEYLENLDLSYLAKRLTDKEGWQPNDAEESVKRYKRFLFLRIKYPKNRGVPTQDIDEVWHAHILHTKAYMADCKAMFGDYFHHAPAQGGEQEKKALDDGFDTTARLYQKEFGEPYSLTLDISSFW